jgi:hypothetical protein
MSSILGHSKLDERATYGSKRQNLELFRKVWKCEEKNKDQVLCYFAHERVFVFRKPPVIDLGFCINDYHVEELNLSMCDLVDEEIKPIFTNFGDNRTNTVIVNLSSNRITDKGNKRVPSHTCRSNPT